MAKSNRKIFAFDMGTSSLGICVREGEKVDRLESLLIPNEYASTKEAAMRRRLIRTRLAHAKREQWWRKCAAEAGIEVLETRQPIYASRGVLVKYKPDPRMLREFSVSGDETVYNSALLRIALLRGKKLDGWQVFKAIWSAFQHRGFMPASELPWARNPKRVVSDEETGDDTKELSEKDKKEQDDEKMNRAAANDYLARISVYPKDCQLPCYYEAGRMGLWDPKNPESFKFRHEKPDPAPARNKGDVQVVAPRTLVEKEIRIMLEKAVVLFPKLKGKIDYVMYGETGLPFASVNKPGEWRCVRGSEIEAQGILGQKTPRFDNRAVNQCCLIPRLNVCKAEKPLNKEVRFLLALKNIRYSYKDKPDCALEPLQINEIFDGFINNKWPAQPPVAKKAKNLIVSEDIWRALLYDKGEWKQQYHITPSKWTKWVVNRLGCNVNPAHTEISAPKTGGRSSYCRPALSLVKELMLSGKDPSGFYSEKLKTCANSDPRKGLVKEDLEFLREMGDSWYSIHIPDNRLKDARQMKTPAERFARRQEIINNVRNPVVRHRLGYLVSRLQGLKDTYGEPERVIFEFVREDFMGKEALHRFEVNIKKNKDARDIAFKEAEQLGLKGQGILKMRLYREQGGFDYYESGENEKIAETEIENCEIDHIVPRALKGPDAFYNLILTKSANNRNKNNRTPFQWIGNQPEWKKLEAKVSQRSCHLSERKKKILLSSEPEKLIEKYTALAETAYIAKLAQKITSLFFGWPESVKDSTKRIFVSNGSQTARVRRQYKLDRLLHPDIQSDDEFIKLVRSGEIAKKNRGNPKHHALDALVISMEKDLEINQASGDFIFPAWFHAGFVKKALDEVKPRHVRFQKAVIAQTIYGMRKIKTEDGFEYAAVTTAKTSNSKPTRLEDWASIKIADLKKRIKDIYSDQLKRDFEEKLAQNPSQQEWAEYIKNYRCKNGTKPRKIAYIESGGIPASQDGAPPQMHGEIFEPRKKSMPGQYIKDLKEHQGQLICKNKQGKWIVVPVYAWESLHKKRGLVEQEYGKGNVKLFKSQQLVEIQKTCNIPAGIYKLSTILITGQTALVKMDGTPFPSKYNVEYLIKEGGLRSAQPEMG